MARVEALEALASTLPVDDLAPLLHEITSTRPPNRALLIAAIRAIGHRELKGSIALLFEASPQADEETMEALAGAFGGLGNPAAEPVLIPWLKAASESTRVAVIRALGRLGTAAAVEPLLPLCKGLLHSAELKSAAREAIDEIQGRLGGAQEGQLSLADTPDEQGALSFPGEAGDLSLADPPARKPGSPAITDKS